MTTKIGDAVARQQSGALAVMDQHRPELVAVLPSHINAESWYASTRAALQRNPDLYAAAEANPQSMVNVLHDAARLGLQPGTDEYYLTWRTIRQQKTVQGQAGYQGEIELIYRAGAVSSVKVELVHEHDGFDYDPGIHDRPQHRVQWFGDRGKVVGAYAYAVMADGVATSKVVVIAQARIDRAIAASPTAGADSGPWKTDYGAMVLKTAAHDLQKWVPTSAEYRREALRAERDVAAETPPSQRIPQGGIGAGPSAGPAGTRDDVVDAEVVDAPASPPPGPIPPQGSQRMSADQQKTLFALIRDAGVGSGKVYASKVLGRDLQTWNRVTADECNKMTTDLRRIIAGEADPAAEPSPTPEPALAVEDDRDEVADAWAADEQEHDDRADNLEDGQ